jgi:hypothetical protein
MTPGYEESAAVFGIKGLSSDPSWKSREGEKNAALQSDYNS